MILTTRPQEQNVTEAYKTRLRAILRGVKSGVVSIEDAEVFIDLLKGTSPTKPADPMRVVPSMSARIPEGTDGCRY